MKLTTTLNSIPGANDGLLEPLLDQVGVNIVGGAGGAAAVPQVAVVVKVEVGVAEKVAVALEHVEQLLRCVLVHRLHLRRHVVVHDEERYLQVEHVMSFWTKKIVKYSVVNQDFIPEIESASQYICRVTHEVAL